MKRITITSTITSLAVIVFVILVITAKNCNECFSAPVMAGKFFLSGLVIFIGALYFTNKYKKTESLVFNLETQPILDTNEATAGLPFSGEGKVKEDNGRNLAAPYSGTKCVYFHSITEEYRKSGKSRHWVVVDNLIGFVPFCVEDDRGRLKVDVTNIDEDYSGHKIDNKNKKIPDPEISEIDCTCVIKHADVAGAKMLLGLISTSNPRRQSEYVLIPGTKVFVNGVVESINGELILKEGVNQPLIVSQKSKEKFIEEFYKGRNLVFFVHLLLSLGFTISGYALNYFLKLPDILLLAVLTVGNVLIIFSIVFSVYNRMITLRERALNALSSIEVELKRRAELVPRIVAVVKEITNYESELFENIANTRVILGQDLQNKKSILSESSLIVLAENYPKLKSNSSYNSLLIELVDTEERIAYSRAFYNRNAQKLNTLLLQFPFNFVAKIDKIKSVAYLNFS